MDTIYTISGGGWYRDSLNAIVSFMATADWLAMVSMATLLSVVVAAVGYIKGHDILGLVKWAATFVLVSGVLISVTRPVQIIDMSNPTAVYQVDNVPVGLVLPASLITTVGHALVVGYETLFHQPDALAYNKTGMLFGADLMGRSSDFLSTNPEIAGMFSDYVQNCVIGDMLLNHKYSLDDLMNTRDPYTLIFARPSPLRGIFDRQGTFQTCAWAAARLQQAMGIDAQTGGKTWSYYVRQLFGGRPDASALFAQMMGNSYAYFYGGGQTASDIMKQNVTLNALRKGIKSYAARNGDTASLVNLASESSYAKLRMAQATSADIATKTLPTLQTVLMGLLLGLFPVVMLLALISALSLEVIKGYVFTLAYLQSWPLLFAILNNAMNFYLRAQTLTTPVTLSNLSVVQQHYSDISSTAGWLALSIPFLAFGIVRGLGSAVSQAGSYLGSALQSASTQSSSQAVDGTWAFNTMQTDNVQGSKWDTNSAFANGHMSSQLSSGGHVTQTAGGERVYNSSAAMSKLPLDINFGRSESSTAQRLARESQTQAQSALDGFNQTSSSAYNQARQFSQQSGTSSTVTTGADSAQGTSETKAVSQMLSAAQSYAQRHHIGEAQAWNELMDKSKQKQANAGFTASAGLNSSKTLWGKAGELITGFSGKGEAHVGGSLTARKGSTDSTVSSETAGKNNSSDHSSQEARDFRQGMDTLKSYRTSESASQADNSAASQLQQLGATLGVADSQYQQYTNSFNRSQEYSNMASAAQTTSAQTQSNYAQEFVGYVQSQRPQQAETLLTDTASPVVRAEREQLAGQFMEDTLRSRVEGHFSAARTELSDGMAEVSNPIATNSQQAWQQGNNEVN
jgi:conjugal transfer mating pair stabilization protein TraG